MIKKSSVGCSGRAQGARREAGTVSKRVNLLTGDSLRPGQHRTAAAFGFGEQMFAALILARPPVMNGGAISRQPPMAVRSRDGVDRLLWWSTG